VLDGDASVWILYPAALVEFVSWKLLGETGSSRESAERVLALAVLRNPLCGMMIAFGEEFQDCREEMEEQIGEVEGDEGANQGTLEEAMEYCGSEQIGHWMGTEGCIEWVRGFLTRLRQGDDMKFVFEPTTSTKPAKDAPDTNNDNTSVPTTTTITLNADTIDYQTLLKQQEATHLKTLEQTFVNKEKFEQITFEEQAGKADEVDQQTEPDTHETEEAKANKVQFGMYADLFRTAMDRVEESGQLDEDIVLSEDEAEAEMEDIEEENTDESSNSDEK